MKSVGDWTALASGIIRTVAFARALLSCQRGSVAIMLGVSLSVLLGMVGLGTEITFVIYKHRQMQSAADSAALGAATALARGYPVDYALEGKAIAGTAGFVNGVDGVTITVNKPPATGNNTANAGAVEVIVAQPQTLKLVSILSSAAFNVSARAVAIKGASGNYCILTTDTATASGMALSNGATINLNQCGAAVNASGSAAVSVIGGARLNTLSLSVKGQTTVSNGGVINATNGVLINQTVTADPYAAVAMPAVPAGCAFTNKSVTTTQTLNPGTYCSGLSISNSPTVTMNPGIYFIKQGSFSVAGGATVNGTGVTIVLTRNASTYATASFSNGATVTLSAPTTGATSGIVFFGDRAGPTTLTSTFAGGSTTRLTGAVYLPRQRVVYSNGTTTTATCTQLIAFRVSFTGGAAFNNNCGGAGTSAIGGSTANALVE